MVSKNLAEKILKTYEEAWTEQNTEKILTIFHKDGTYHENPFQKKFEGHKEIKEYWDSKVVKEQSDIDFKLLNYYTLKNTLIAEWEASFNSNIEKCRFHIKEVAILEIKDDKISSLREYWNYEVVK